MALEEVQVCLKEYLDKSEFLEELTKFARISTYLKSDMTLILSTPSPLEAHYRLVNCCWDELHSNNFNKVDNFWRIAYKHNLTILAYKYIQDISNISYSPDKCNWNRTNVISRTRKLLKLSFEDIDFNQLSIADKIFLALSYIDRGLIMCEKDRQLAQIASKLHNLLPFYPLDHVIQKKSVTGPVLTTLNVLDKPTLIDFLKIMHQSKTFVISDLSTEWACREKWKSLTLFSNSSGYRLVPIEVGDSYMDDSWGQEIDCLGNFLLEGILEQDRSEPIKYLAQYEFFDKILDYSDDFSIPEYCSLQNSTGVVATNLWFGPGKTRSPFHFDEKHNLLAQIIGSKIVLLIDPIYNSILSPSEGIMSNTSSLRLRIDHEAFLRGDFLHICDVLFATKETRDILRKAEVNHHLLKEGDTLYIPPGVWHHIEAIKTSISLSFWW